MAGDRLDLNSKRTRVEPVFRWLRDHGGAEWAGRLVGRSHGLAAPVDPGRVLDVRFEAPFPPHPDRLAWMVRNADRLLPRDLDSWRSLEKRVLANPAREELLRELEAGRAIGRRGPLVLEGATHADCLVECERAVIWVEGKRRDWLDPGTKWDVTRDQLARNVEAAWRHATAQDKDYYVLLCHEERLKHHEELLVQGYRAATWAGGLPHVAEAERRELGRRIGTLRWAEVLAEWPALRSVLALHDVAPR